MKPRPYRLVLSILLLGFAIPLRAADWSLPSDEAGWTVLKPAADTRVLYVSSARGNDATGMAYPARDRGIAADPFHPRGQIRPYKTIAAATAAARDGAPDWILLERGGEWTEMLKPKSGAGPDAPALIAAYGEGTARPLIKNGMLAAFRLPWRGFHDIAIVGIAFYAHTRDPQSAEFVGIAGDHAGITLLEGSVGLRLLVEDCLFQFNMVGLQSIKNGPLRDLVFRRNLFLDSYSTGGHCQGIYAHWVVGLNLEENTFDHDGWFIAPRLGDAGKATVFNHNAYISECDNLTVRGNVFLRSSSIGLKMRSDNAGQCRNAVIDDNLFVEGEVGVSIGGNTKEPQRYVNVTFTNNVFTELGRGRPTGRTLSWGIDLQDWDGGLVANNLVAHQKIDAVDNTFGLRLSSDFRNVLVRDNVIDDLYSKKPLIDLRSVSNVENVLLQNNSFAASGKVPVLLAAPSPPTGFRFSGNTYTAQGQDGRPVSLGGRRTTLAEWNATVGEKQASDARAPSPDPTRTIESYEKTVAGTADFARFVTDVRQQSRGNWRREYTAAAVNAYFRAGFGLKKTDEVLKPVPLEPFVESPGATATSLRGNGRGAAVPSDNSGKSLESRRRTGTAKKRPD